MLLLSYGHYYKDVYKRQVLRTFFCWRWILLITLTLKLTGSEMMKLLDIALLLCRIIIWTRGLHENGLIKGEESFTLVTVSVMSTSCSLKMLKQAQTRMAIKTDWMDITTKQWCILARRLCINLLLDSPVLFWPNEHVCNTSLILVPVSYTHLNNVKLIKTKSV